MLSKTIKGLSMTIYLTTNISIHYRCEKQSKLEVKALKLTNMQCHPWLTESTNSIYTILCPNKKSVRLQTWNPQKNDIYIFESPWS